MAGVIDVMDAVRTAFLVARPEAARGLEGRRGAWLQPASGALLVDEQPGKPALMRRTKGVHLLDVIRDNRVPLEASKMSVRTAIKLVRATCATYPHLLAALNALESTWCSVVSEDDERRMQATPANWDNPDTRDKWSTAPGVPRPSLVMEVELPDYGSEFAYGAAVRETKRAVDDWVEALLRNQRAPPLQPFDVANFEKTLIDSDELVALEEFACMYQVFLDDVRFSSDSHAVHVWRTYAPPAAGVGGAAARALDALPHTKYLDAHEYAALIGRNLDDVLRDFNQATTVFPYARTPQEWWVAEHSKLGPPAPPQLMQHASETTTFSAYCALAPLDPPLSVDERLHEFVSKWLPAYKTVQWTGGAQHARAAAQITLEEIMRLEDNAVEHTLFGAMDGVLDFLWEASDFEMWLARLDPERIHAAWDAFRAIDADLRKWQDYSEELGVLLWRVWRMNGGAIPTGPDNENNLAVFQGLLVNKLPAEKRKIVVEAAVRWSGPEDAAAGPDALARLTLLDPERWSMEPNPVQAALKYEELSWRFVEGARVDGAPPPSKLVVLRSADEYAEFLCQDTRNTDLLARTAQYVQLIARGQQAEDEARRALAFAANAGAARRMAANALDQRAAQLTLERASKETEFGLQRRNLRAFADVARALVRPQWFNLVRVCTMYGRGLQDADALTRTAQASTAHSAYREFFKLYDDEWAPRVARLREARYFEKRVDFLEEMRSRESADRAEAEQHERMRALKALRSSLVVYFQETRLTPSAARWWPTRAPLQAVLGLDHEGDVVSGPGHQVPYPVVALARLGGPDEAQRRRLLQEYFEAHDALATPTKRKAHGLTRTARELRSWSGLGVRSTFSTFTEAMDRTVMTDAAQRPELIMALRAVYGKGDRRAGAPRGGPGEPLSAVVADVRDADADLHSRAMALPPNQVADGKDRLRRAALQLDTAKQTEYDARHPVEKPELVAEPPKEVALVLRATGLVDVDRSSSKDPEFVCGVPGAQNPHNWCAEANRFLEDQHVSLGTPAERASARVRVAAYMETVEAVLRDEPPVPPVDVERYTVPVRGDEEAPPPAAGADTQPKKRRSKVAEESQKKKGRGKRAQ